MNRLLGSLLTPGLRVPRHRATTAQACAMYPFHAEAGQLKAVFTIPLSVTDTLRRRRMMTTEEYAYARARARRPVKVTLPSPLMLFLVWSPQRSRDAYPDPFAATSRQRINPFAATSRQMTPTPPEK